MPDHDVSSETTRTAAGDFAAATCRCAGDATFEAIVAAMQEGVIVIGGDGRITSCNAAAQQILGLATAQMHGRTTHAPHWLACFEDGTLVPPGEDPSLVALRTGQPQSQVVLRLRRPEGTELWLSINSQPIRGADGRVTSVVTTFTDISTARLQADRIAARERQLALVLEGSNDGFWDWHIPSGKVTYSPRWLAMLGYAADDLEPHVSAWERLVHPDDRTMVHTVLSAHLRGERAYYETEHRMRHRDGRWLWILDRGKVVERDAAGTPVRAAGTHTDITQRRETEIRLRQALDENSKLVEELQSALRSVKTLSGLLPVCAWCKSVRDDRGYWQRIEQYLSEHTDARFTHGLCPDCNARILSGQ